MAVLAMVPIQSARTHLNDDLGVKWPDSKLFPKLQEAYRELIANLIRAGIPITYGVSAILTVPAISTDDSNVDMSTVTNYPTDIIEPIWMKERMVGEHQVDFIDMIKCDFIPNVELDTTRLIWWNWEDGVINLRGCLSDVQVQLRYRRNLSPPSKLTDSIIVPQAENFLSYRIAALAMGGIGDKDTKTYLSSEAMRNLETVISINVKGLQGLPTKRKGYHRGGGNRVLRDF